MRISFFIANDPGSIATSSGKLIQQGARMLGIMEREQGIAYLKPEWGPKLSIYQVKPDERPSLLAEFSVAGGWVFNDTNLGKAKPGLTGKDLTSALKV